MPCIKAAKADVCVLIVKMEKMQDTIEEMRTQMKELTNDRNIQKVESDANNVNKEVRGELYGKALNENKLNQLLKLLTLKGLQIIVKNWLI